VYQKSSQISSPFWAVFRLPCSYVVETPKAFCAFYTGDKANWWIGRITRQRSLRCSVDLSGHMVKVQCGVNLWQDQSSDRGNVELSSKVLSWTLQGREDNDLRLARCHS
jgi:hypothetical protein